MSIFIPFAHEPESTVQDSSTSYTVPTGYYARATITMNVAAYVSAFSANNYQNRAIIDQSSDSVSLSIWLAEGDVLSKTTSAASDTVTTGASANASDIGSPESQASVSVDNGGGATVIALISCRCTAIAQTSSGADSMTISGDADVNWHIEKYPKIS